MTYLYDVKSFTGKTVSLYWGRVSAGWGRRRSQHDDVIKWKPFPRYWPFVRGINRSPVNSLYKGQWRGAVMFSLICAWINGWVNNGEAGDLRRHRVLYDVTAMRQNLEIYAKSHLLVYENKHRAHSLCYLSSTFKFSANAILTPIFCQSGGIVVVVVVRDNGTDEGFFIKSLKISTKFC